MLFFSKNENQFATSKFSSIHVLTSVFSLARRRQARVLSIKVVCLSRQGCHLTFQVLLTPKKLLFFGSWNYLDGVGSVDHHLGEELSVSTDELARHRSLDRVDETLLAQLVDRVTQMFLHRDRKG